MTHHRRGLKLVTTRSGNKLFRYVKVECGSRVWSYCFPVGTVRADRVEQISVSKFLRGEKT